MNEVKTPKKPLIYYYTIAMLVLLLMNLLVTPLLQQMRIKEVDYGTFMTMTENKEIGEVEIEENRILFTDKDGKTIYQTGLMDDPGRTERLYASGAKFSSEIVQEMSPLLSFLLTWILPIVIFTALGQFMAKKLMDKAGGGGASMMFNMGKSNAKVYVKSSDGIKFDDVAGEDE
ncbi:MAG: cell division protein FtsH, partial [Clostridiales bacterium]|nr:cell division protein FtsH [Clostridiales bacterium]